jgi:hypothetical protein
MAAYQFASAATREPMPVLAARCDLGLRADGATFFLKTDDGLLFHFDAISRAVSIPIMVQDALMTWYMPPALLTRMAREIEHVQYAVEPRPPPESVSRDQAAGKRSPFGGLSASS